MKTSRLLACLTCAITLAHTSRGASLGFSSGSLSNTTVRLSVTGPTNLVCELQRLNPTNDTWIANATFTLSSAGAYNAALTLPADGYGYYRVKSTNGVYFSTNAFGAMQFILSKGYTMVGNPFATLLLTNIFPAPAEGMIVYRYGNGNWASSSSFDFGAWSSNDPITRGEGALVYCPETNVVAQFYGLFDTNSFSRTLPAGWSLMATPLYHIISSNLFNVDNLTASMPGGLSNFPIPSGTSPKAELDLLVGASGPTYNDYVLTTTNTWQLNNTNVSTIPILWSDGFWWRNVSTNSITWTINSIPIW
jgi:hypothetical protein